MQTNHDVDKALALIRAGCPIVMIVGRAGTGKSTLIRSILEQDGDKQVVLASTGVAAVNVGGQTIHSFFRIPPRLHNKTEIKRRDTKLFKNLQRVIIDEISMVRADLLDTVDYALRINCKKTHPFGGVQMVLVGDFMQLAPVVRNDEKAILTDLGYATPFAFSAQCLRDNPVTQIELCKVYRQDDPEFVRLLGNLRFKHDLQATIEILNQACCGPHKRKVDPVILTGTNAVADRYNQAGLNRLPGRAVSYEGAISGEFNLNKDKLPVPLVLTLKVGARIMMTKNDKINNWVNGTLGTVVRLGQDRIWVNLDDQCGDFEVAKGQWDNIRYVWDKSKGSIQADIVGNYAQIPVIPAWALTIHKAQGLTLDNVRIDLATGAFASGQAYVALSRARSLEGLSFATPLRSTDIIVDSALLPHIDLLGKDDG